jgi:hypothetical protein
MDLFARGLALALVVSFGVPQAGAREKPAPYKFVKDGATKYDVSGDLRISLKGSHAGFLMNGIEEPIRMTYRAQFENVVTEVSATDGSARLQRKVRTLSAEGMVQGVPFKFEWDQVKDKGRLARPDEGPESVKGLFLTWCVSPLEFTVTADGKYDCKKENYDQLVNKAGAMYWLVGTDTKPWLTEEKIAAPLLHNKIIIEFKNEFTKTVNAEGRKLLVIGAKPRVKGTEDPPPGVARIADGDIEFTVTGEKNKVEFDTTNHRLHSVNLDLKIRLSGQGQVPTGGKGDIRGEVTLTESQKYKE